MKIDMHEKRLDALLDSLEAMRLEYEETIKCCVEVIQGVNARLERLERWMSKTEMLD
jgi:hypothetical protein